MARALRGPPALFRAVPAMSAQHLTTTLRGRWYGQSGRVACVICQQPNHHNPALNLWDAPSGDITVHCNAGCDWRDVKDALLDFGYEHSHKTEPDAWNPQQAYREMQVAVADDTAQRSAWARRKWLKCRDAGGTPVETYLRARGITRAIPPTIRSHPSKKHRESGRRFPAMVAAVTVWPSREVVGIHRTFLRPHGLGEADVHKNKMMAGPCGGGAVRLAPAASVLALAEGLETSLSVQLLYGEPVWAALSGGNLARGRCPTTQQGSSSTAMLMTKAVHTLKLPLPSFTRKAAKLSSHSRSSHFKTSMMC